MKAHILRNLLIGFLSTLVLGGGIAAAVTLKPWQLLATGRQAQNQHLFALELHDAVVPLHSTQQVKADILSKAGITSVQFWVNGQLWSNEVFDSPRNEVSLSWPWTPSAEGVHDLKLVYDLSDGETISSTPVSVYALSSLDVNFPVEYTIQSGDTLASIADQFGSPIQSLQSNNPGQPESTTDALSEGDVLVIPVIIPNAPPSYPLSGELPAPPVEPLPSQNTTTQTNSPESLQPAMLALPPESLMPGFQIINGAIKPFYAVDQLYLYFRLGDAPWSRSPADPHAFFNPNFDGTFDVSLDLDLEALQKLPNPLPLDVEAWGWKGGALVFLGLYNDQVGGPDGSLSWPPTETQLKGLDYTELGKPIYKTDLQLSGDQPTLTRKFHWSTSAPGTSYILWQVSRIPFQGLSAGSGLIHSGNRPGLEGDFILDFRDYFKALDNQNPGFWEALQQAIEVIKNSMAGGTPPQQVLWSFLPSTFYVRAIPMGTNGPVGKPSNSVSVHFTPAGIPVETSGPLSGPVYDAKVVSFTPYRPADASYSACFVSNYEIRQCKVSAGQAVQATFQDVLNGKFTPEEYSTCTTLIPKGQLSCGCPGVQCSSGGDTCGDFSLNGFGDCLQQGAEVVGSALKAGYDFISQAYNDTVAFVKEMVAKLNPICIQAKMAAGAAGGDTVTVEDVEAVCKAAADIAVTAVMTYFGLPPSLPNLDKLAEEGLDYAIGVATSQMGIDCNKQCRDLIKKGVEAVASGENLLEEGLEIGASMAADELKDLGINCDAACEKLIKDGVQGKATFGQVSDLAIEQATQKIVSDLQKNGYPCDSICEDAIRMGLEQGAAVGEFAATGAAQKGYEPPFIPHPLALEQPAIIEIEVFRRWESSAVPDQDVSKCAVSLFNQASNASFTQMVQGKLFSNVGLEMPVLEPGESMVVPVVLEREPWFLPIGVSKVTPPIAGNEVYASLLDPVYGSWYDLYRGAQLSINVTGPQFLTLDGQGGTISLPCVAGEVFSTSIPLSP